MPILNFKQRFALAIKSGEKKQTIRAFRKIPIKKDDHLYLYTGLRTKNTIKLGEAICNKVSDIIISHKTIILITWNSATVIDSLEHLDEFAHKDGFKDWTEMHDWFENTHGLSFKGHLIEWSKLKRTNH